MKREFTDDMREISGFGGTYEGACRVMVLAGLDWLDAHPDVAPKFSEYENVTGIINSENPEADAMIKAMCEAAEKYGEQHNEGGVTGAMVHATVHHTMYAHTNGWEAYAAEMRAPEGEGAA